MGKIIVSFLLTWALVYVGYLFLKHSSWAEKRTLLKGLFISGLTAFVAMATLAFVVLMF